MNCHCAVYAVLGIGLAHARAPPDRIARARELGVTILWQEAGFDQLLPSLTTGRIDVILSGLSENAKRRAKAEFIDDLNSGVQFFTSVARRDINQPADLCGESVEGTNDNAAHRRPHSRLQSLPAASAAKVSQSLN